MNMLNFLCVLVLARAAAAITAADATCDNGVIEVIANGATSCTCQDGFFGGGEWVSGLTYPACTDLTVCTTALPAVVYGADMTELANSVEPHAHCSGLTPPGHAMASTTDEVDGLQFGVNVFVCLDTTPKTFVDLRDNKIWPGWAVPGAVAGKCNVFACVPPAGQFETKAAGATSDRECSDLTVCSATQYESKAAGATSDRECSACAPVVNQKIAGDGPGLTCTDGTDSTVARCIDGYAPLAPTGDATAHTCTACNPVANANADAAPTCPDGKDTTQVDACAVGYWRERSSGSADLCKVCDDDANKATGTTVSCDPNDATVLPTTQGFKRLHGFCKAGYHLVHGDDGSSGSDDECTACAVCPAGKYLHGCEADTEPTCPACTAIANMASSGALTCTSQYDSKVTPATDAGCASQYSLIKVAVGADGETHTCIDETHHSCAGTGPEDTGAGCENGNTPVGVSHAATRTTATLLLAGAMLAVTLIGR